MTKKVKYYIEAGANDGLQQSRSLHLKDNSEYHGIMIEPNPVAFSYCQNNRNPSNHTFINAALVPLDYENDTIDLYGRSGPMDPESLHQSLMGTVSESIWMKLDRARFTNKPIFTVPAKSLQEILDSIKVKEIEYFYLDVEGYESSALRGVTSDIKINNLEVELHDQENEEQETQIIVDICKNLDLVLIKCNRDEGYPKLIFKREQG